MHSKMWKDFDFKLQGELLNVKLSGIDKTLKVKKYCPVYSLTMFGSSPSLAEIARYTLQNLRY